MYPSKCFLLLPLLLTSTMALSGRAQEVPPKNVLIFYAIKDLVLRLARPNRTIEAPTPIEVANEDPRGSSRLQAAIDFAALCETFITPPLNAGSTKDQRISATATTLLANVWPVQHEWIRSFRQSFLDGGETSQLLLELRVLKVPESALQTLGLSDEPMVLDTAEREQAFLDQAIKLDQVDVLNAPSILVLNGQWANLSTLNQKSYIKRYDVIEYVEPGRMRLVDPVVDAVSEGLLWDLRTVRLPGDTVGIESKLSISELTEPMAELETPYGKIALPEVKTTRIESVVRVKPGQCFVLMAHPSNQQRLVVMLKASNVEVEHVVEQGTPSAEPTAEDRKEAKKH